MWDVGANIGLFTFAAAHRAASVIAIEPDPRLADLLRRSAEAFDQVKVLEVAISDSKGSALLNIASRGRAANFLEGLGTEQSGGVRKTQTVTTLRLDQLLDSFSPPDFIKVDAEGAELKVLRGGEKMLREVRPTILIEIQPSNYQAATLLLKDAGYVLHSASEPGYPEIRSANWNTLAVHSLRINS